MKPVKEPGSILVVTLSNIGDVVMTTPVIMALRMRFPEARITVVVGPKAKPVLEKSKAIQRIVVYDKKADLWGKWEFLLELWKDRYDMVVDLRNTAIPFLVLAPRRSPLFRKYKKINMRERHLEVLSMMGMQAPETAPFRFFDEADEISLLKKIEEAGIGEKSGWILVAPGAASERKRWPAGSFREVIRELAVKTSKDVLLIGSKEERAIAEETAKGMPARVRVLAGETSLSETAFLLSRAALVIANDSAIMHLGYETGASTVGIFGPTDHKKYGHKGPKFRVAIADEDACGCNSHLLPYSERSCFHGLSPEQVLRSCAQLMQQGTGAQ
ncbi:MAG: Lipopolysaccharide core heptosyltransferase RfaQ [Candidatus Omnitrophica bacterium ADurb.Bin277]|nr:MAG: Lipopolysaccharide core heptosyltransferase RfaQ [Candidatus Omnitrophica bacterium ADurb.Bin277]